MAGACVVQQRRRRIDRQPVGRIARGPAKAGTQRRQTGAAHGNLRHRRRIAHRG